MTFQKRDPLLGRPRFAVAVRAKARGANQLSGNVGRDARPKAHVPTCSATLVCLARLPGYFISTMLFVRTWVAVSKR
jgi:hypothetical protein